MRFASKHRSPLPPLGAGLIALLVSCGGSGSTTLGEGSTGTVSTGQPSVPIGSSTTNVATTSGLGTTTDSTTDPAADSSGFIDPSDAGPSNFECDLFEQDCPEGQKCMPASTHGQGRWNSTICVPIAEDPGAPGEPCTAQRSATSGMDDCELGAFCGWVDHRTLEGMCIALCTGPELNPTCADPESTCRITAGGPLFCIAPCDPLAQDCHEGQGCYWDWTFECIPDGSADVGAAGDSCDFTAECDPGNQCVNAEHYPGCEGFGCCATLCDLDDPMPPCLPDHACVPFFDRGTAPPEYEHIGVCLPP